jgi:hypothetical protein
MKRIVIVLLTAVLVASRAAAEPTYEPPVVLLVTEDPELGARVRGQISDLPYRLVVLDDPAAVSADADPQEIAAKLARGHHAELVVWLEPGPRGGWKMIAADVSHGDLLVRQVALAPGDDRFASSAAAEAAALVVRSTLLSLSRGARLGEPPRLAVRTPEPPASEVARRVADARHVPERWVFIEAHLAVGKDSAELGPWYGPGGFVGGHFDDWEAGVVGTYGGSRELTDAFSRLRVRRYDLGARISRGLWSSRGFEVLGSGEAGALVFERHAAALASNVTATPDARSVSPRLGLFAEARFRSGAVPVAIVLSFGGDVVFLPPALQYVRGAETLERARLWPIQPAVHLAVQLRSESF